jgi:hypothetical protein
MANTLRQSKFAVCVNNENCDDLQVWKIYRVLSDTTADVEDYLRVVDESGEDYLYPASRFVLVEFPELVEQRLLAAKLPTK